MKKGFVFVLLLVFLAHISQGQYRVGLEVGIGQPVGYGPGLTGSYEGLASYTMPAYSAYVLRKVGGHLFLGIKAGFETFSYSYHDNNIPVDYNAVYYFPFTLVNCKSSYLTLGPVFDVGMGKHQYVHFSLIPELGVMISGAQTTTIHTIDYPGTPNDLISNTSSYLRPVILRLTMCFTEHLPLSKTWHLTLSESLEILSSSTYLSDNSGTNGQNINCNGFSLKLGLMRKYKVKA